MSNFYLSRTLSYIDLHGQSRIEVTNPFWYTYKTGSIDFVRVLSETTLPQGIRSRLLSKMVAWALPYLVIQAESDGVVVNSITL